MVRPTATSGVGVSGTAVAVNVGLGVTEAVGSAVAVALGSAGAVGASDGVFVGATDGGVEAIRCGINVVVGSAFCDRPDAGAVACRTTDADAGAFASGCAAELHATNIVKPTPQVIIDRTCTRIPFPWLHCTQLYVWKQAVGFLWGATFQAVVHRLQRGRNGRQNKRPSRYACLRQTTMMLGLAAVSGSRFQSPYCRMIVKPL
jgi:hypothetical protein